MSQKQIETVIQRYAQAWAAGDGRAIVECYHDDIVFHYFGRSPLAGEHRGKAACLNVLKLVREKTSRKLIELRDVSAGARYGFVVALERFERDGRSVEIERVLKYTVRDDKLAECWVYDEDQVLVDSYFA